MLPSFADDTVTLTEVVWVDDRGKKTATYPGPGLEVHRCIVQPAVSSSDFAGRDNVAWEMTLMLPPGTVVTRHTKISFEGEDYRVWGRPHRWKSPTGSVSHIEVRLVAWEG